MPNKSKNEKLTKSLSGPSLSKKDMQSVRSASGKMKMEGQLRKAQGPIKAGGKKKR